RIGDDHLPQAEETEDDRTCRSDDLRDIECGNRLIDDTCRKQGNCRPSEDATDYSPNGGVLDADIGRQRRESAVVICHFFSLHRFGLQSETREHGTEPCLDLIERGTTLDGA